MVAGVILIVIGILLALFAGEFGRFARAVQIVALLLVLVGVLLVCLDLFGDEANAGVLALPLLGMAVPPGGPRRRARAARMEPVRDAGGVSLSPTVRWLLTALSAGVTTFGGLIAAGQITDLPAWVGIVLAVLSSVLGVLNVVPPQVGGTQQGLASPSITEPPAADVE